MWRIWFATKEKKNSRSKNAPVIDIELYAFSVWGVNVFDIPGLKDTAVMQLVGELGMTLQRSLRLLKSSVVGVTLSPITKYRGENYFPVA